MPVTTIGDLAQNFKQRSIGTRLHRELSTLNLELTTGLKQDVSKAVAGKTAPVAAIERALTLIDARSLAVKEADIFANATAIALSAMSSRISGINIGAMSITDGMSNSQIDAVASSAKTAFTGMLSDLGTQAGGRPLFGGATGSAQVTPPGEEILTKIVKEIREAGAKSAEDIKKVVTEYFGVNADSTDEGLFQTNDYGGAKIDMAPFDLGDGSKAEVGIRADDPAIREVLANLATIAVLGENLDLDHQTKSETLTSGMSGLLQGQNILIGLEARVGSAVASIEGAAVRIETERNGFEMARLDLLAADPYQTATRLQQTENQISIIYTLTARLSGLNLVSYLR